MVLPYIVGNKASDLIKLGTPTGGDLLNLVGANIGIGTASPAHKLSVFGDSSGNRTEVGIDNIDQRLVLGAYFETGVTQYSTIQATNNAEDTATNLILQPDGGKVGIGTSSPARILTVAATEAVASLIEGTSASGTFIDFTNTNYHSNGVARLGLDSSGNMQIGAVGAGGDLLLLTASATRMAVLNGGNVGIGTTSPAAKLSVTNTANDAGAVALLLENADGNAGIGSRLAWRLDNLANEWGYINVNRVGGGATAQMDFAVNGAAYSGAASTAMSLDSTGLTVDGLIGTINGTDIDMDSTASGQLRLDGNGYAAAIALNAQGVNIYTNSGTRDVIFGTNEVERMRIDGSGNVGIGTASPASLLSLEKDGAVGISLTRSGAFPSVCELENAGGYLVVSNDATGIDFQTGATPASRVVITSTGKVGIGTASPAHKLTVSEASTDFAALISNSTSSGNGLKINAGDNSGDNVLALNDKDGNGLMRVLATGKVGIGTTSPTEKLEVAGNVRLDASNAELNIAAGTTGTTGAINFTFTSEDTNYAGIEFVYDTRASVGPRFFSQNGYHLTVDSGDALHLKTDGNDRLTINNGGDVFMHGTTINGTENDAGYSVGGLSFRVSRNTTSNANQIVFYNPNGAIGAIQTNGSATAYNTSSDYRLKENVVPMQDALQRITQLKPSRFNFIADDSLVVDGFLAHEVQEHVPEAISGEKDAMKDEEYEVTPAIIDDDGNEITPAVMDTRSVPDYQGIDQSKLVPLLVGAIQELTARIAALENN